MTEGQKLVLINVAFWATLLTVFFQSRRVKRKLAGAANPRQQKRKPHGMGRLLRFGNVGLSYRQLMAGGAIFLGPPGTGKTSAMLVLICELLVDKCGALLNCVKSTDAGVLLRVVARAGRKAVVLGSNATINMFRCLPARGDVAVDTVMCAAALEQVFEALGRGGRVGEDGGFWKASASRLLKNLIAILLYAGKRDELSVRSLLAVLRTAPRSAAEVTSEDWQRGSFNQLLRDGFKRTYGTDEHDDYIEVRSFWLSDFPTMPEKTRGGIEAALLSPMDVCSRGAVHKYLFDPHPTLDLRRAVAENWVILNPVSLSEFREQAVAVAVMLKYLLQVVLLERQADDKTKPFVLYLDEYQTVMSEFDAHYVALARSSAGPFLCACQGIESIRANFIGENAEAKVETLINNLTVRCVFSPGPTTARWLIDLAGTAVRMMYSGNRSTGDDPTGRSSTNTSGGVSQSMVPMLTASDLQGMRTGGHENNLLVDFLVYVQSARGSPFRWGCIKQENF